MLANRRRTLTAGTAFLLAFLAAGLTLAWAGEQPEGKPGAKPASPPARAATEKEVSLLRAEVERLQMENAKLKELAVQLQQYKALREEAAQLKRRLQEQIAGDKSLVEKL